jgi:hypothetical protein
MVMSKPKNSGTTKNGEEPMPMTAWDWEETINLEK